MAVRDDVLAAVAAMSAEPSVTSSDETVQRLVAQGYSLLQAEVLETFVNLAFGRAWIRRLDEAPPIGLADTALIWCEGDEYRELRLTDVPEYIEALALAEEALSTGTIPWDQFSRCCGSSEVDCINQTIEAGRAVGGASLSPPIFMRLSDTDGFEDWYQRLQRR